jgi:hypothetical protein
MGMLEDLKHYLENTPREQLLAEWKETEKFDFVGPTVGKFIRHLENYQKYSIPVPRQNHIIYKIQSQEIPKCVNISSISVNGKTICKNQKYEN